MILTVITNGDFCLKHFAKTMKSCFPEDSIIGRYGGDEFVVYLKNLYRGNGADLYGNVSEDDFPAYTAYRRGCRSFQPAQVERHSRNREKTLCLFVESADMALYKVKQNGKADFKMKGM